MSDRALHDPLDLGSQPGLAAAGPTRDEGESMAQDGLHRIPLLVGEGDVPALRVSGIRGAGRRFARRTRAKAAAVLFFQSQTWGRYNRVSSWQRLPS